jgi:hypothetical protein
MSDDAPVRQLHSEFKIYHECDHDHAEDDPGVLDINDVGLTCEDGYWYSICLECCTHGSGEQPVECAENHYAEGPHNCWPCRTIQALDGSEAGS